MLFTEFGLSFIHSSCYFQWAFAIQKHFTTALPKMAPFICYAILEKSSYCECPQAGGQKSQDDSYLYIMEAFSFFTLLVTIGQDIDLMVIYATQIFFLLHL